MYNQKIKKAHSLSLKRIFIAAAGPFANLMFAIMAYVFLVFNKDIEILSVNLETIIYSNILLLVFNLIPIYPLDGGRIIKELMYIFKGLKKAYIYTNKISNICIILITMVASVGVLLYKNIAIVIIIVYLWAIVIRENIYLKRILANLT